jgi:hypothetical protein
MAASVKKNIAKARKRTSRVLLQNLTKKRLAVSEEAEITPNRNTSIIFQSLSQIRPYKRITIAIAAVANRQRYRSTSGTNTRSTKIREFDKAKPVKQTPLQRRSFFRPLM